MKRLTIMFIGLFMVFGSLSADEIIVHVPLDIDGIPNNGNVITDIGRSMHINSVYFRVKILGCDEERIINESLPLPSEGIHKTVTIEKTFATECGSSASNPPQVTIHMSFSDGRATSSAKNFSEGLSSLKPLIITNVDAVRGYF